MKLVRDAVKAVAMMPLACTSPAFCYHDQILRRNAVDLGIRKAQRCMGEIEQRIEGFYAFFWVASASTAKVS